LGFPTRLRVVSYCLALPPRVWEKPVLTLTCNRIFFLGCGESGDGISDTNREGEPASGCPIGRDTCPSSPGTDPVQNYMDYSDDSCLSSFTGGQFARMLANWNAFRTRETRPVTISVVHDGQPRETAWTLSQKETNFALYKQVRGSVVSPGRAITRKFFLNPGVYRFFITDSGNNGLCCRRGRGSFSINVSGRQVQAGGRFANARFIEFTVS
jgi:hypothetical protein